MTAAPTATPRPRAFHGLEWFGRPVERGATGFETLWLPLSAWGAASAALMLSVTDLLWQHLPKLRFVQLPFRWLLCMNAALAMLLTMSARRWPSRALASALLLAAVIVAWYRFQQPWWETASDIREMHDALADGTGYEGTDEYVPAGADSYELNKNLPLISDNTGTSVPSQVLMWGPIERHFMVHAATPQNLTVRVFNYPAWEVEVNGKPVRTRSTNVTGLMIIPLAAGASDVHIYFRRTNDRVIGNVVSLISFGLVIAAWSMTQPKARPGHPGVIPRVPPCTL